MSVIGIDDLACLDEEIPYFTYSIEYVCISYE